MPRGDKSKYSDRQKRQAEHIAASYEERGIAEDEAKRRAWATVNEESGGGEESGSGRAKKTSHAASQRGGRTVGSVSGSRSATQRSTAAKKAAATRKRNKAQS